MKSRFLLLTEEGVLTENGETLAIGVEAGRTVSTGFYREGSLYLIFDDHDAAVVDRNGLNKLGSSSHKLNCIAASADGRVFAGTAGAHLIEITDGTVENNEAFEKISERKEWTTPWGGPPDVRSLAVSLGGVLFANIHVGWIARSKNDGGTWEALTNGLEKDVHQVQTHPSSPEIVFAATADGFYLSRDLGDSFTRSSEPMEYYYQRACLCSPETGTYIVSTSRGPHGTAEARVYRSTDSGLSWHLSTGLPETIENNIDTFQLAAGDDGRLAVVVEDHHLYLSGDDGARWNLQSKGLPKVNAVLSVDDGFSA